MEGELKVGEREEDVTTVITFIEEGDFQWAMDKLLIMVAQLEKVVEFLIYMNKLAKVETNIYKTLLED